MSGFLAFNGNDLGKLGTICKLKDKFLFWYYLHYALRHICSRKYIGYIYKRVWDVLVYIHSFRRFCIILFCCCFFALETDVPHNFSILSIVGVGYLSFFSKYEIAFF